FFTCFPQVLLALQQAIPVKRCQTPSPTTPVPPHPAQTRMCRFPRDKAVSGDHARSLQSQDKEDAERYRWLCDKFGITKLPCAIERIIAGDVYVADGKAGIDEAIDHARRIEGDGE